MEYVILKIARMLRQSGISVSAQEITDCLTLLKTSKTDTINSYAFYRLLNATMIKTQWGADYAQWLIELYFEPDIEISNDRLNILSSQASAITGEGLGSSGKIVPIDSLIEAVLNNKLNLIYVIVKGLNLDLELQLEDRTKALENFQHQSGFVEVSEIVENSFQKNQLSTEDYQKALLALEEWNNILKNEIELMLFRNMSMDYLMKEMKKRNPRTVSFLDSEDSQFSQMSREIQKLGRRLAIRKGRRRKISPRGPINLDKSMRQSLRTGGIPLALVKMQKKPSKPDLWILCDMSNSVSKFSYFMLMFIYTTQKQYSKIRSFFFVDMLLEVTDYFQERDWSSVLSSLSKLKGFNITGYSHYGNVLQQFADQFLPQLTNKTTVIILGDGKNNGNRLDGSDVLARIKENSEALYWLNPLSKNLWNVDDSVMENYKENCTGAYSCSNIEQLEDFLACI